MWAAASLPALCYPNPVLTTTTRLSSLKQRGYDYSKLNPHSPPSSSLRRCSSSSSASYGDSSPTNGQNSEEFNNFPLAEQYQQSENNGYGLWKKWREKSAEMSSKLAKLGLSAVLAYGVFDAVTYTSFFVLAFLGYEKSTGQNPAANLKALIGIVILMWTGNNVTRPFRVAGAAALAPFIDKGLKKIQKYFNFPTLFYAFALVVAVVATPCLVVVGLLILSRWGK